MDSLSTKWYKEPCNKYMSVLINPAQALTEAKLGWIGPNLASLLIFSPPVLWTGGFWMWEICFF